MSSWLWSCKCVSRLITRNASGGRSERQSGEIVRPLSSEASRLGRWALQVAVQRTAGVSPR